MTNKCPYCFRTIGTWLNDPTVVISGSSNSWISNTELSAVSEEYREYKGCIRIGEAEVQELQDYLINLETLAGVAPTTFTPLNISGKFQIRGQHIKEMRESVEKLLTHYGISKQEYFNYDADGNFITRPEGTQLDWTNLVVDDDWSKFQVRAIHIEELRHYIDTEETGPFPTGPTGPSEPTGPINAGSVYLCRVLWHLPSDLGKRYSLALTATQINSDFYAWKESHMPDAGVSAAYTVWSPLYSYAMYFNENRVVASGGFLTFGNTDYYILPPANGYLAMLCGANPITGETGSGEIVASITGSNFSLSFSSEVVSSVTFGFSRDFITTGTLVMPKTASILSGGGWNTAEVTYRTAGPVSHTLGYLNGPQPFSLIDDYLYIFATIVCTGVLSEGVYSGAINVGSLQIPLQSFTQNTPTTFNLAR